MDWRAGHLTTTEGTGVGHLPTKIARMAGHLNFFSNARGNPGVCPGGGCSRLELTRTLIFRSICAVSPTCKELA